MRTRVLNTKRSHTLILTENSHFLSYGLSDFYETFKNESLDPNKINNSTKINKILY